MAHWFYAKDGQKHGPVSSDSLRQLASQGVLRPSDSIWREGLTDWVPAAKVKGLFSLPPPLPSPPSKGLAAQTTPPAAQQPPSQTNAPSPYRCQAAFLVGPWKLKRNTLGTFDRSGDSIIFTPEVDNSSTYRISFASITRISVNSLFGKMLIVSFVNDAGKKVNVVFGKSPLNDIDAIDRKLERARRDYLDETNPPRTQSSGPQPIMPTANNRPFCWQMQLASTEVLHEKQVTFAELSAMADNWEEGVNKLMQNMVGAGFELPMPHCTMKWRPLQETISLAEVNAAGAIFLTLMLTGGAPDFEHAAIAELFRVAERITGKSHTTGAVAVQRPLALTLACMPADVLADQEILGIRTGILINGTRSVAGAYFRMHGVI